MDAEATVITRLVTELRQPAQLWEQASLATALALLEGRFAEAENLIANTAELGGGPMSWNASVSRTIQLFVLRRPRVGWPSSNRPCGTRSTSYPTLMRFRCALAHLHAELGRGTGSPGAFDAVLPSVLAGDHVDAEWLVAMCLLPDVCAFLRDSPAAAGLYTMLLPYRHLYAKRARRGGVRLRRTRARRLGRRIRPGRRGGASHSQPQPPASACAPSRGWPTLATTWPESSSAAVPTPTQNVSTTSATPPLRSTAASA